MSSEARLQIDKFVSDRLREADGWVSARELAGKVCLAEESIRRALGRLFERGHAEQSGERYRSRVSAVCVPVGFSRRPASARSWKEEIETTVVLPNGLPVVLYVYDTRITDGGQMALFAGDEATKIELQKRNRNDVVFEAGELFGDVADGVIEAIADVCAGMVSTCETVLA